MASPHHIAFSLAAAIASGQITEEETVSRAAMVFGRRWRWVRSLAKRLELQFGGRTRPRKKQVYDWLRRDDGFRRACRKHAILLANEMPRQPQMDAGTSPLMHSPTPEIATVGQLANWLDTSVDEMLWLADRHCDERSTAAKYRRYRYRFLSKRSRRFRLIEVPIYRLKSLQRRLLSGILNQIEPHAAAHGFRLGRSIHSFAADHTRRQVVLKMDLQDCFATIGFGRVSHLFRRAGYPERVADTMAAMTTNTVPTGVWNAAENDHGFGGKRRQPEIYSRPHLPQGAPTSPALANQCLFKLDLRLTGLATTCGARYSRYADDLAFSGDNEFASRVNRVRHHIAAIIEEEGFRVNHRKTRIMRSSTRQRIAGIVVNQHRNIERREYDQLKAILYNCGKHGLQSQNHDNHADFRAHLAGRVAFAETVNPIRGRRLRTLLNQIEP